MPAASSTAGSIESAGAAAVSIAGAAPTAPPSTAAPSTCVVGTEIVLAVITYRGEPAVATLDTVAHIRRARAIGTCTILAQITDPGCSLRS